jgi:hypothetical protein
MDLSNVAAGKQNDRCLSPVGGIGLDRVVTPAAFALIRVLGRVGDFVTCRFASVGVRKMSVGGEDCHLAEGRIDPHAAIGFVRPADLDARCMSLIGNDLAAGERYEVADECVGPPKDT